MNTIPSAVEQSAKLMKDHPASFKDCSLTQLLIAQAMQKYMDDCHEYMKGKQNISVFENPEQIGLTKTKEEMELDPLYWGSDNKINNAHRQVSKETKDFAFRIK